MKPLLALLLVALGVLHPNVSRSQWLLDGTSISRGKFEQLSPRIASDGAGGAIVAWYDSRCCGATYDIYAQRVNSAGLTQWTAEGVPICTAPDQQFVPTVASDGAGGAIIAWYDIRNGSHYDVYAQRINAFGMVQWAVNGVALCTAAGEQSDTEIVSDGSGGAIVTWYDSRTGTADIYAQRINASGVVQWAANGVALCTAASGQGNPVIVSDGAAGAVVAWHDSRSGNFDIFAQRVNASGVVQWVANGVGLCTAASEQAFPEIISDTAGGAIVAWRDLRHGNYDIYAQRINSSGVIQWISNGTALCIETSTQATALIAPDGVGGAVVTWSDSRSGATDGYAQRINSAGVVHWLANGVLLTSVPFLQSPTGIVSDGAGGAMVTFTDNRSGATDVYAQKINGSGAVQWGGDGVALCANPASQVDPRIIGDETGGALVAWSDYRTNESDIYAQRVEGRYGYWGRPEPVLDSASDNPDDQGGKVVLNWQPSGRDVLNQQTIYSYSIWRALDEAAAAELAASAVSVIDAPLTKSAKPGQRVVWREREAATIYYWELVGSQIANYSEGYSYLASTRQDSVAANTATHYFRVVAETYSQFINWPSNVLSAHSVDNLAPAAPLMLSAQRVGANVNLRWNRAVAPDLRDYSVYRATASGVTPVPINFLSSSDDTVLVDGGAPTSALYYIVTAYDVHANQSAPSNEAHVSALTGIGDTPPMTLTVLQNHPNPFAGTTDLRIGLPGNADMSIEVYDVAGRRVRTQSFAQQQAGWRAVPFDGRNDAGQTLSSGVYFYRVTSNGTTVTNKMVIAR